MGCIYEPSGKAREYSPLALNIYNGCDHGCQYCYVKNIIADARTPKPKFNLLSDLEKDAKKGVNAQVLLCFMSDPYCNLEMETGLTRKALEILNRYDVPVSILTKGGSRILRDLDIIKSFASIKVGATLTFDNPKDSLEWEPGAALPQDRLNMLKRMHEEGIKTWVSIEPVISPKQSMTMIALSLPFVDQYKIGRWNHDKRAESTDWAKFGSSAVELLRAYGKQFYVKDDLAIHVPGLTADETNHDLLAIKPNATVRELQGSLF